MFVQEFRDALAAGACDELLGTLRPAWDEHAAAVGEARTMINAESSAEHILESGQPGLVECWQQLPGHLAALNQIVAVARQFGPRVGNFPMISEYANADGYKLEDTAIWCAAGNNLEVDSAAFRRPAPPSEPAVQRGVATQHPGTGAREVSGVGLRAVGRAAQWADRRLDRRARRVSRNAATGQPVRRSDTVSTWGRRGLSRSGQAPRSRT